MSESNPHTFVLTITDKPGVMELIAATFAQRGVSISTSQGTGGALSEGGNGKILLTFNATPAKKEVLRRALQRLSRVQSLVEYDADSPGLRKSALVRLAPGAPIPAVPQNGAGWVEKVDENAETGEATYLLVGAALAIDAILHDFWAAGTLRDVTQTTLAL